MVRRKATNDMREVDEAAAAILNHAIVEVNNDIAQIEANIINRPTYTTSTIAESNEHQPLRNIPPMSSIKINLKGVGEFTPVDAGHYPATFTAYKFGKTKETADDKVDVTFTLSDGAGEFAGRKQFRTFTFTEKALWAFKNFLVVLGHDIEELNEEIDPQVALQTKLGTEVVLLLDVKEYPAGSGKMKNEVAEIKNAEAALLI